MWRVSSQASDFPVTLLMLHSEDDHTTPLRANRHYFRAEATPAKEPHEYSETSTNPLNGANS